MKLRLLILLAVAVVSLAFGRYSQTVLAQTDNETVKFKNVNLWVNPEYDDPLNYRTPNVLTMLEGELDGAAPPVRVSFLVPASAGMYSAGSLTGRGGQGYTGGPPDRNASDIPGWDVVSYELKTNIFRVEYYDPSVISGGNDKTISYDFRTISPISSLNSIIQQPKGAANFSVTPEGTPGIDNEGFTIYSTPLQNVSPDSALHFDIAYSSSASGNSNTALIIGVTLGVIVVGAGIIWILKSQQAQSVPARGSRQQRRRVTRQGGRGNRFCTSCGQPMDASDKFCPSCGAKI